MPTYVRTDFINMIIKTEGPETAYAEQKQNTRMASLIGWKSGKNIESYY